MINKIKSRFSLKIFLITSILFLLVSTGTLILVSKLIPSMYTNMLNDNLNSVVDEMLVDFSKGKDINSCIEILRKIDNEKNNAFWIYDNTGILIYSSNGSVRNNENYEDYFNGTSNSKDSHSISQYSFTLADKKQYTLTAETNLSEVSQVKNILLTMLPYAVLLDLLISLLCSIFYSKYISKPIVKLCEASQRMAAFNFAAIPELKRDDEIGTLSTNLNFLSQSLQSKIKELNDINEHLKSDIDRRRDVENTRLAFFAATSHELKTPITILKGHLNGMLDRVGNYEDRDKYLKRSIDVTEQMEMLIKELLFVAQINENKTNIHFIKEDFAEVIRLELSNVMSLLEEKEMVLNIDLSEHMVCRIDKNLMHIILQNLMMNAIRYSPKHEIINIKSYKDNDDILFEIENTGIHIPEESLDKLFDAFYKIDTGRSGGTGLGLYIVRELLEKLNAEYKILNTSHGVKFKFVIKSLEEG